MNKHGKIGRFLKQLTRFLGLAAYLTYINSM